MFAIFELQLGEPVHDSLSVFFPFATKTAVFREEFHLRESQSVDDMEQRQSTYKGQVI